jgi:hypothetical protein
MAIPLRYLLVSDGPTDRVLIPIIDWVLDQIPSLPERGYKGQFAERDQITTCTGLAGKISSALRRYPCDLLFVHRDAESSDDARWRHRLEEIRLAMQPPPICYVPIVPVRMTEAWLLLDRDAIYQAAENPKSGANLSLPPLRRLEDQPDPKTLLHELLAAACELRGRRLKRFRGERTWRGVRVADYISDFSPLRQLSAFRAFEEATRQAVESLPNLD